MLWKMTSRLPLGVFKTKSYLYAAVTLSNTRGLMLFVRPKTHTIEYKLTPVFTTYQNEGSVQIAPAAYGMHFYPWVHITNFRRIPV